jgi:hypothetical protein
MYAMEFEAPIENGIVRIPKEYHDLQQKKKVKFIVIYDNDNSIKNYGGKESINSNFIDEIINNPRHIDVNSSFLSREEVHER